MRRQGGEPAYGLAGGGAEAEVGAVDVVVIVYVVPSARKAARTRSTKSSQSAKRMAPQDASARRASQAATQGRLHIWAVVRLVLRGRFLGSR